MESAKNMYAVDDNGTPLENTDDVAVLNSAIASFNSTASELEQSYKLLHAQVKKLNREVEEKNRQLEKNLLEKERVKNFLSSILESLPTGVVVTDLQGQPLMSNSAVEKITGVCPADMDKDSLDSWLASLGMPSRETASVFASDAEYAKARDDIRNLKTMRSPVYGADRESIGCLYIVQDQTRLKKLEMQSERDNRLKAMGEMAIKIAHEVRNPLGSIELLSSIMRRELEDRDDLHKMAERIITEVKSLDNAISNLLLFTRPQKPLLHELNLTSLLEEFVEFIRPIVTKNCIELFFSSNSQYVISGDRDLLKQVFLNLTLNAIQAMPDKGIINIDVQAYSDDDDHKGKWVEIVFRDTGIGIPKESLQKIFHPFFSSKDKGTGLGLAIVHNIIESHNGTIEARSEGQGGTTFLISLPRVV